MVVRVDGKYQVILKTPMGAKRGELTLKSEDGILTGSMIALGKDNAIMPGTANDDEFQFSGELRTAVGKLAYECSGKVEGNVITGTAQTKKGNLAMSGKRIS